MKKEREEIEEITRCPECGSSHIIKDSKGETLCEDCGLVLDEDSIDYGPEWTALDREQREKKERTGPALTPSRHDRGLSTTIGYQDAQGRGLPLKTSIKMFRLRKLQKRMSTSGPRERSLAQALSQIARLTSLLGLPRDVRETASLFCRRAFKKNLLKGRRTEEVVATVLYAACRQCKISRTLDEIATVSRCSRKALGRTFRALRQEIGLQSRPTSPTEYIPRFCNELKLSIKVQNKTMEIIKEAKEKELFSGRNPAGIAAASIYIATLLCEERRNQRDIANVAGVTEVTIRNRYKELDKKLNLNIEEYMHQ